MRVPPQDDDLAARCARGDGRAWQTLHETFSPTIRTVLIGVTRDVQTALDLEQDLFLRLLHPGHRAMHDLAGQGPGALRAYLRTSALHMGLDHQRSVNRRPRHVPLDGCADLPGLVDVEKQVGRQELHAKLIAAARESSANPDRDALIFALYFFDGYSAGEIAVALGMGSSAVETVILRLAGRLRERFDE